MNLQGGLRKNGWEPLGSMRTASQMTENRTVDRAGSGGRRRSHGSGGRCRPRTDLIRVIVRFLRRFSPPAGGSSPWIWPTGSGAGGGGASAQGFSAQEGAVLHAVKEPSRLPWSPARPSPPLPEKKGHLQGRALVMQRAGAWGARRAFPESWRRVKPSCRTAVGGEPGGGGEGGWGPWRGPDGKS